MKSRADAMRWAHFEQNTPVLTLTRNMGCCNTRLRVSYLATSDDPHPLKRAERDLEVLVHFHRCSEASADSGFSPMAGAEK